MSKSSTPAIVVYVLVLLLAVSVTAFESFDDDDDDLVDNPSDLCPDTPWGQAVSYTHGCSCEQMMDIACDSTYGNDAPCCIQPTQGCEEYLSGQGVIVPRCCEADECAAAPTTILPDLNLLNNQNTV